MLLLNTLSLHDSILVTCFFITVNLTITISQYWYIQVTFSYNKLHRKVFSVLLIRLLVTETKNTRLYKTNINRQTFKSHQQKSAEKEQSGNESQDTTTTPQFHMLYPLQNLTGNFVDCFPIPDHLLS